MFIMTPLSKQYLIAFIANIHMLNTGIGFSWSSPVLVKLTDEEDPALPRPLTSEEASWVVSISSIVGIFSPIIALFLADRIGRKNCFVIMTVPRILTYIFLTFANELWMLIIGRVISGIADGFAVVIVPLYASEIASKEIRGSIGTMVNVLSCAGGLFMWSVGPYMSYFSLNLVILCICVASSLPLILLPDTPYSLYNRGKKELCLEVLKKLRGTENMAMIEMKEFDLKKSKEGEDTPFKDIIRQSAVMKAAVIVFLLSLCLPLTGAQAIVFYLQTILESTNTNVSSNLASLIIGIVQFVGSVAITVFIDKFRRKPILTVGLCGMAVGSAGLGTFFQLQSSGYLQNTVFINILPLISLLIYQLSNNVGLSSLFGPLTSELFNGRARTYGVWISQSTSLISIFITTKSMSTVLSAIGPITTYYTFTCNCLIMIVFIWIFIPETKGKTFLEIEKNLGVGFMRRRNKNKSYK